MNQAHHEAKRLLRFEPGEVSSESTGNQPNMSTAQRGYPRTETGNTLPEDLMYGQRTVMLSGGDQDYPIAIGISPWVT